MAGAPVPAGGLGLDLALVEVIGDKPAEWQLLEAAGVDKIGTDRSDAPLEGGRWPGARLTVEVLERLGRG